MQKTALESGLCIGCWEGCRESRRCSRDTYPESCITKNASVRENYDTMASSNASQPASSTVGVVCSSRKKGPLDANSRGLQIEILAKKVQQMRILAKRGQQMRILAKRGQQVRNLLSQVLEPHSVLRRYFRPEMGRTSVSLSVGTSMLPLPYCLP